MTLTCYGAAGGVTGSKHLLAVGSRRILLDCGIFQGPGSDTRNGALPFDPTTIDAVILSHAHADHSGMLPMVVRNGFRGMITTTSGTRDILDPLLRDAATVAVEDAAFRKKHRIGDPAFWKARYHPADVPPVLRRIHTIPYARNDARWHPIADGVRVRCYEAGHIVGSAIMVIECAPNDAPNRIAFSGDLGPRGYPILRDPEVPREPIDTVICESTYGDTILPPMDAAVERLAETIRRTAERKGKIIIPAFALGRTQLLIYLLHKLMDAGHIPHMPIIIDSPLASTLTRIILRHAREFDAESQRDFRGAPGSALAFPDLHHTETVEQSKALNERSGPLCIISSSGMMTNGRIVHHLRHTISDERNTICITGYQATGTTGRAIQDGAKEVTLHGDVFPIRAEIVAFDAFSAHADRRGLTEWLGAIPGVRRVVLIHGEDGARAALAEQLRAEHPDWRIDTPREGETLVLA